tara:strand:- start:437 stop:661 length:225 start_codon:yes stop_codon:yes gene_type:complete
MAKKLSEEIAYEIIVELYADELSFNKIAKEFDVSREAVGHINAGRTHRMEGYKYPIRLTPHKMAQMERDKHENK